MVGGTIELSMRASLPGAVLALSLAGCNFVLDGVQGGTPMDTGDLGGGDDLAVGDLAAATGDLARPPDLTPVSGSLSGAIATTADGSNSDLTLEGTRDWVHWGRATATSFDHKNLVTSQISNFTNVGGTTMTQLGSYGVG